MLQPYQRWEGERLGQRLMVLSGIMTELGPTLGLLLPVPMLSPPQRNTTPSTFSSRSAQGYGLTLYSPACLGPAGSLLGIPACSKASSMEKLQSMTKVTMSLSCSEYSSSEARMPVQMPNSYF